MTAPRSSHRPIAAKAAFTGLKFNIDSGQRRSINGFKPNQSENLA
jgi:hypothetical protein